LQPLSSPHQPRAERREAGAAALFPFHQGCFEKRRPLFDQIPGMPVRHAFTFGGVADLAVMRISFKKSNMIRMEWGSLSCVNRQTGSISM
jgi:hypothetical protein